MPAVQCYPGVVVLIVRVYEHNICTDMRSAVYRVLHAVTSADNGRRSKKVIRLGVVL